MVGLARGTVELVPYDEDWADEYEHEADRLRELLGDRLLGAEHVGSTSVPGLDAKPIIDLLVVIDDLDAAEGLIPVLEDAGYEFREESVPDRLFFAKGPRDDRTHYLSLAERGSDTYRDLVLFRDSLRANPGARDEYCDLKRDLAERYPDDRESYTSAKAAFIEDVIDRAASDRDD